MVPFTEEIINWKLHLFATWGATLKVTKKNLQDLELPQELYLTTRQKTKIRHAFTKNMSTNIKLSKAQFCKIIQSGWFLGALFGKLAGPLMKVVVLSTNFFFAPLATEASDSAIDGAIQRKIPGQGVINEEKRITSVISNVDMGDMIKIIKPLENLRVLPEELVKE